MPGFLGYIAQAFVDACAGNHVETVELLLAFGAKSSVSVNLDDGSRTSGTEKATECLRDTSAPFVRFRLGIQREHPLWVACKNGHLRTAQLLLPYANQSTLLKVRETPLA